MKILLITKFSTVITIDQVNSYQTNIQYNLYNELIKIHDTYLVSWDYDNIYEKFKNINFNLIIITHSPKEKLLRNKNLKLLSKTICGISEIVVKSKFLDFQLTYFGCRKHHPYNAYHLDPAINTDLFRPLQKKEYKTILIDHTYYSENKKRGFVDITHIILSKIMELRKLSRYKIKVIRFAYFDKTFNFVDKYKNEEFYEVYKNKIKYKKVIELHNSADIFIPTHKESFGMSILEAASSGSIILNDKKHSRIKSLLIVNSKEINFKSLTVDVLDNVFDNIEYNKNRKKVLSLSYKNHIKCIFDIYNLYKNKKEKLENQEIINKIIKDMNSNNFDITNNNYIYSKDENLENLNNDNKIADKNVEVFDDEYHNNINFFYDDESCNFIIGELYKIYLNRTPDKDEFLFYKLKLNDKGFEYVVKKLKFCNKTKNYNFDPNIYNLKNEELVIDLYNYYFQKKPDKNCLNFYVLKLYEKGIKYILNKLKISKDVK